MRPTAGGDVAPLRSRKSSIVDSHPPGVTSAAPTTFFMAREEDILGPANPPAGLSRRSSLAKSSDGAYGVQSLEEALGEAFGDKSPEDHSGSPVGIGGLSRRKRRKTSGAEAPDRASIVESLKDKHDDNSRHSSPTDNASQHARPSRAATMSQPLTPLQLESPIPDSAIPSTPKSGSFRSLRLSDEEESIADGASQAITSGGEEDEDDDEEEAGTGPRMDMSGSAMPELVMPSLSMPSRRPFTARGKQMGRLKICVAGPPGVGKTSLIRAIVQQCEDIVHIDPISTTPNSLQTPQPSRPKPRTKKQARAGTSHITEIHASTKAYPSWWSEMEESRVLRRRKSMGETVLERNICFIDTPGNGSNGVAQHVVQFLESLLHRNASISAMNDSDLLGILSGSGGVQADVILYVIPPDWKYEEHIEYCSALSMLTNVVPIIGKADTLSDDEIKLLKTKLLEDLHRCGIRPFMFGKSSGDAFPVESSSLFRPDSGAGAEPTTTIGVDVSISPQTFNPFASPPFAISCLPGSDDLEMDASLLMSPSYSPPLITSDLQDLVSLLFDPENMAWLRHGAVRKFLAWRERKGDMVIQAGGAASGGDSMFMGAAGLGIREQIALARSQQRSSLSPSGALIQRGSNLNLSTQSTTSPFNLSSSAIGTGLPDFTRARLRDHTIREERLAQVQLAKWASDLQKNLRFERESFERLAKAERAKWLLDRIGEEVLAGTIGLTTGTTPQLPEWALPPRSSSRSSGKRERKILELPTWARNSYYDADARDPLGLCTLGDSVRSTTNAVVKVLGGGVLVGAIWVAIARAWGVEDRFWHWWGGR